MLVSLALPDAAHVEPSSGMAPPAPKPAGTEDVEAFQVLMSTRGEHVDVAQAARDYAQSLSSRFDTWRSDWTSFGANLDLNDHTSALRVVEQQARLSSQSIEFQFALQSADSVRHAFKTLYQQQA